VEELMLGFAGKRHAGRYSISFYSQEERLHHSRGKMAEREARSCIDRLEESSTRSTKTIHRAHLVRNIDPKSVVGAMTTESLQGWTCNAFLPAVSSPAAVLPIL
jgi:hypothetical protein